MNKKKNKILCFASIVSIVIIISTIFLCQNNYSNDLTINELMRGLKIKYWILSIPHETQKNGGTLYLEWIKNNEVILSFKIGDVKQNFETQNKLIIWGMKENKLNVSFINGLYFQIKNLSYGNPNNRIATYIPTGNGIKINRVFFKFAHSEIAKLDYNTNSRYDLRKDETGLKFVVRPAK